VMKEFLFEDKTEDLVKLIGFSPIEKCYIVINAELATDPNRSYCYPSSPPRDVPVNHGVQDQLLLEAFRKGLDKYVWPKKKRRASKKKKQE